MTSAPFTLSGIDVANPTARPPSRRNLFLRAVAAVGESNRRKAEREVARYIERNGGRLTDSIERAIERAVL